MKSIQVNSLPLKGVLKDIADAFQASCSEHCSEYSLSLPSHIGKGTIKGINFKGGLGLIQYDCTFAEDLEIQFITNTIHPLKFLYNLEGSLDHRFENEEHRHKINQYQSAIVASYNHNGHILMFKSGSRVYVNSLEIDRAVFKSKMTCELNELKNGLEKLFLDIGAKKPFYHEGDYSLQLADLFSEMQEFEKEDFLRKIFLEGKAYQVLTQQILQYQDDLKNKDKRMLLRKSEIKTIKKVADLIENEISHGRTIEKYAQHSGLNVNKLQTGFKQLYHLTVNGYIQKTRLKLAKKLLQSTDLNISEIVDKIGLSSKSYFSKIFKEEYHTTPSQFKKNKN